MSACGSRNFLEIVDSVQAGPLLDLEELAEMSFSEVQRVPSAAKVSNNGKTTNSPDKFFSSEQFDNNPFIKKSGVISLAESFKAYNLNASVDNFTLEGNLLEETNLAKKEDNAEEMIALGKEQLRICAFKEAIPTFEYLSQHFQELGEKLKQSSMLRYLSEAQFQDNVGYI